MSCHRCCRTDCCGGWQDDELWECDTEIGIGYRVYFTEVRVDASGAHLGSLHGSSGVPYVEPRWGERREYHDHRGVTVKADARSITEADAVAASIAVDYDPTGLLMERAS